MGREFNYINIFSASATQRSSVFWQTENRNGTIDLFSGLNVAAAASSSQKKLSPFAGKGELWELATGVLLQPGACRRLPCRGSEGPGGSAWRGMLRVWMAEGWEAWISCVGRGLAVAEQPGAAGNAGRGVCVCVCKIFGCVGGTGPPCLALSRVGRFIFCMYQVRARVEIKLGRREGAKKKKQVKPDRAGSV